MGFLPRFLLGRIGEAAAVSGGGLLGVGVGLAVGAGALVEEGRVDLWSDEVMGGAEVECVERERARSSK